MAEKEHYDFVEVKSADILADRTSGWFSWSEAQVSAGCSWGGLDRPFYFAAGL